MCAVPDNQPAKYQFNSVFCINFSNSSPDSLMLGCRCFNFWPSQRYGRYIMSIKLETVLLAVRNNLFKTKETQQKSFSDTLRMCDASWTDVCQSFSFGNVSDIHCIDVLKEKFAKAFVAEKNYALHVKARRNMVGTSKRKVTAATDDFADTFQLSLSLATL